MVSNSSSRRTAQEESVVLSLPQRASLAAWEQLSKLPRSPSALPLHRQHPLVPLDPTRKLTDERWTPPPPLPLLSTAPFLLPPLRPPASLNDPSPTPILSETLLHPDRHSLRPLRRAVVHRQGSHQASSLVNSSSVAVLVPLVPALPRPTVSAAPSSSRESLTRRPRHHRRTPSITAPAHRGQTPPLLSRPKMRRLSSSRGEKSGCVWR